MDIGFESILISCFSIFQTGSSDQGHVDEISGRDNSTNRGPTSISKFATGHYAYKPQTRGFDLGLLNLWQDISSIVRALTTPMSERDLGWGLGVTLTLRALFLNT